MWYAVSNAELYHHGIIGQKWGVRRYQNADGTRTPAGRKHRQELEDLSGLSDQEMQQKLNRARNELQYHQTMKALREEKYGKEEVDDPDKELRTALDRAQNELKYYQTMRNLNKEASGKAERQERVQAAVKDLATVAAVTGSVLIISKNGKQIIDGILKTGKAAKSAAS